MSKSLSPAAAIIALSLGLATMGPVPALATNHHGYHTQPGYAGPVPLHGYYDAHQASAAQFVPGRRVL